MTIYLNSAKNKRNSRKTRRIYLSHHNSIPVDEHGRSYEIHHLDGNHSNDDITNLVAVTIQEHYNIHEKQGDVAACHAIAVRMKKTPEEISHLAKLAQKQRVESGNHNWSGPEFNLKRVELNIHPFSKNEVGDSIGQQTNIKRVTDKTHNWLKREDGSSASSDRVKNGNCPLSGPNSPGKYQWICEHCGKEGKNKGNYSRFHKNGKCLEKSKSLLNYSEYDVSER